MQTRCAWARTNCTILPHPPSLSLWSSSSHCPFVLKWQRKVSFIKTLLVHYKIGKTQLCSPDFEQGLGVLMRSYSVLPLCRCGITFPRIPSQPNHWWGLLEFAILTHMRQEVGADLRITTAEIFAHWCGWYSLTQSTKTSMKSKTYFSQEREIGYRIREFLGKPCSHFFPIKVHITKYSFWPVIGARLKTHSEALY